MKKITFLLPLLVLLFLVGVGCNSANDSANASTKDTTAAKDSIKADPEKFSDPH